MTLWRRKTWFLFIFGFFWNIYAFACCIKAEKILLLSKSTRNYFSFLILSHCRMNFHVSPVSVQISTVSSRWSNAEWILAWTESTYNLEQIKLGLNLCGTNICSDWFNKVPKSNFSFDWENAEQNYRRLSQRKMHFRFQLRIRRDIHIWNLFDVSLWRKVDLIRARSKHLLAPYQVHPAIFSS